MYVRAEITNMSRPIGREIGNKNEVLEAIRTLQGNGPSDFKPSSCDLAILACSIMVAHDE